MMGTKIRSFSPLPRDVSLEQLVPSGHFYRRLEAEIDLSFVRELVAPLYAGGGRPSVDPVVFFKLQLVMFFEDLRSERQLMRVVADRLSLRWYLGYDLHEPLPDHSSLTRIRERYGLTVLRRFFERIVEECFEAGLVRGDELFFDSTTLKADAARGSLVPRLEMIRHVEELFQGTSEVEAPPAPEPPGADAALLPTADDPKLKTANAAREDSVSSAGRSGAPPRVANPRPKRRDEIVSRTDPDARLAGHVKATAKMGYKVHYVVDGGKARVIVNALATRRHARRPAAGQPADARPALEDEFQMEDEAPQRHRGLGVWDAAEREGRRAGRRHPRVHADHRLHARQAPLQQGAVRLRSRGDVYVCPAGEVLKNDGVRFKQQITRYIADPETCNACALKARCTDGKSGRAVARSFDEEYYDRVRSYRGTLFAYEKALRKRKVWIEPIFAEAKEWHGMREVSSGCWRR